MVLRSDLSISYYKDAAKPPLGVISLKDPSVAIRVGQRADCSWPKNCRLERSLVLTTTKRRFYLFAESVEEAQEWLSHLQAAVEQATGQWPGKRAECCKLIPLSLCLLRVCYEHVHLHAFGRTRNGLIVLLCVFSRSQTTTVI